MAITNNQFTAELRGIFSGREDSTGTVRDFCENMTRTVVENQISAISSVTTDLTEQAVFGAERKARVRKVRFVQDSAVTTSATDNWTMGIIKRAASSWSVTTAIATLTSNVAGVSNAGAMQSNDFTLSSTSAELELVAGDTLSLVAVKGGAGALLQSGKVILELE